MKKILTLAIGALALAGCSSTNIQNNVEFEMSAELLSGKSYIVTHLNDVEIPEPHSATMKFQEDRVSGRGFCNSYSAIYEEDLQGDIVVDQMLFTQRMCDEASMQLDSTLSHILQEYLVFEQTPVGYKATSENGSFEIMEYDFVQR